LKDPYLLDFFDLKDGFTEKDLEAAILTELERFILELGRDFAFLGRRRHLPAVLPPPAGLVELNVGEFRPGHKGQVELHLKRLARLAPVVLASRR